MNFIRNNFFLIFGLVGLLMWAVVLLFGLAYDDGGLAGVVWWTAQLFAIPYLFTGEILSVFSEIGGIGRNVVVVITGLMVCVLLDQGIKKFRGRTS